MAPPASTRHVALFRGINVGKAKRVAMADLRALFESLGFGGVRSLLNSGNVVFSVTSRSRAKLDRRIANAVTDELGVEANVLVLDAEEFRVVVDENPLDEFATNGSRLLVNVLQDPADRRKLVKLAKLDWGDDAFGLGSRAAYLWCAAGVLGSDLPNAVVDAVGDTTTARNWNTVNRIAAALEES